MRRRTFRVATRSQATPDSVHLEQFHEEMKTVVNIGFASVVMLVLGAFGPLRAASSAPFEVNRDSMERLSNSKVAPPVGTSAAQQAALKEMSKAAAKGDLKTVSDRWSKLLKERGPRGPDDISSLAQYVLKESYAGHAQRMKSAQAKVKSYNDLKEVLRNNIAKLRAAKAANPNGKTEGMTPKQRDQKIEALEEQLNRTGDSAQQANIELQELMSEQQQLIQTLNNVSKMLFDSAMSVLRKIG